MRKVRLLLTVLLLCIAAAGCQKQNTIQDDPDKINVTATIFPQYDFTREIAGDQVDLRLLLPPGGESHSYEPTPQDIITIQNSDVFIYVGGESDAWIEDILASMDTSHMQLISLMDCVDAVEEEIVDGMQAEEHHEGEAHAEETEYDEHVWTSPANAILITEKITEALQTADTKNAELYQKNCDSYVAKLDTLDQEFHDLVSGAAHKVLVFGDRFPFRYFTEEYGLEYYAAFPGCSAETEPSAATISFLINQVKAEQIPVVFHIEFSNEKVADAICESTGAKKLLFHSCHNVDQADMDAGVSYLSIMQGNLKNLKEALQ